MQPVGVILTVELEAAVRAPVWPFAGLLDVEPAALEITSKAVPRKTKRINIISYFCYTELPYSDCPTRSPCYHRKSSIPRKNFYEILMRTKTTRTLSFCSLQSF